MMLDQAYPGLFSTDESRRLASMMGAEATARPRERVVRGGIPLTTSLYICSGFMGRFCCDRLGRRQFVALQIPGDYVDLSAYLLKSLDHDIDALGPSAYRLTPHEHLDQLKYRDPDIYHKLWRISMMDSAIHRYWIFRVGRLQGKARLANLFSEMFVRLFSRGLAAPEGYVLPTSQADLAEICGVTPVHVNRLLAELRLDGICTFANGRLVIHDLPKLFRVGEHSRGYLCLDPETEERIAALIGGGGPANTAALEPPPRHAGLG